MSKSLKIYTIGAMSKYIQEDGNLFRAEVWRNIIKSYLFPSYHDIEIFDPTLSFDDEIIINNNTIVTQNDHFLKWCDIAICNLQYLHHSYGSIYELSALRIMKKPVYCFNDSIAESSPHVDCCITEKFSDLDELLENLTIMYFQFYIKEH